MILYPNAKINLGLDILRNREDGYHEIESVMYPIPFRDILEIVEADELKFESSGLEIPGDPSNNLCIKAWDLLHKEYGIAPVHIFLHKQIPMGGGLGGGSADGSFCLLALNELFQLDLPIEKLEKLAAQLGSDCPFFIQNQSAIATGTGTNLEPLDLNLKGWSLLLILPEIHVSTQTAYSGVTPYQRDSSLLERIKLPIGEWKDQIENQFEKTVFPKDPLFQQTKDQLYSLGAEFASLTGSGAAMFGLFRARIDTNIDLPHYWFNL